MNEFRHFSIAIAAFCFGAGAPAIVLAGAPPTKAATVSESAARSTALAAVPGGLVQSAELETEHAVKIWSFDIGTPSSKNVVEVQVDAHSGKIVSKKLESPADQRKEAQADMKAKP